jgi:hypothetical protein
MTSIILPMTQHIILPIKLPIKLPITLPGYYIAKRTNKNGCSIEQHIKLESTTIGNSGETLYTGYYGNYGYHEIYCRKEDIRPMTKDEIDFQNKSEYWNLPQQFYQTFQESPEFNTPIETNSFITG